MLLEEIVEKFGQQAGMRVGVLVEYPRSKCCEEVLGTFLGRRDGCRDAEYKGSSEYKVRAASVVLLIEEQEQCKSKKLNAFQILWDKRIKSVNKTSDGCHFDIKNKKIKVWEVRDDKRYAKGLVSNFFVLNLSEQSPSMSELVAYAADIEKKLIEFNVSVENLGLLATYDDLKWLCVGHPCHIPKPVNRLVKKIPKSKHKKNINVIENDVKSLEAELEKRRNDLLDAKDRLHPFRGKLRKFFGSSIMIELVSLGNAIVAVAATAIGLAIADIYGIAWYEGVFISDGGTLLITASVKTIRYRRILSKRVNKFLNKYSCIEESRKRQAEKLYENRKNN